MAETNGKNKWIMWLVGLLATLILVITLPTMASAIWTNDRRNTDQHEVIKKTMIERDEAIVEKVEAVKDIVTDIRIQQMEQMTILKRLDK